MSSIGKTQRFEMGARVDASDGHVGKLTRVVIDPVEQALTHLVVEPHREGAGRLVPVDLVDSVERERIRLSCTVARFHQLDYADDMRFLPTSNEAFGYGEHSLAWPYYGLDIPRLQTDSTRRDAMLSDRVPLGEVEIHRGDQVHATDGWIGAVEGLVIDPTDHHVTHILLQEGHLWGRKQVAIPIGKATPSGEEVHVALTKEQVQGLPAVPLSSPP